jgi:uncharacterized protein with PIN domain
VVAVAWFRFYAELNDFLPLFDRGKQLKRHFDVPGSVKDLTESFGVPHTEIDLVLMNGMPVTFAHLVHDGDRVSVYPAFQCLDISSVTLVRPPGTGMFDFVLDVHLGRLAAYLRMAGFDALYRNDAFDAELAALAARERRVLLTRDRYLLMRSEVERGYWVRSTDSREQLIEVVRRFHLAGRMRPFTRCMKCNHTLEAVDRDTVAGRLPPGVRHKEEFQLCKGCNSVYWEGTHYHRMKKLLEWVQSNARMHMNQPDPEVFCGGSAG